MELRIALFLLLLVFACCRTYWDELIEYYGKVLDFHSTSAILNADYKKIRSIKLAAYFESSNELNRRITDIIKSEASDNYADKWESEKFGFLIGSLPKVLALQNIVDDSMISTICETGFNVGYGVLNFLIANPTASVVSFDIFSNRYGPYAVRALHDMFPNRDITVIAGDSMISVPNFFRSVGRNVKCDMMFIDSGNTDVRNADIVNLKPFANYEVRQRTSPPNPNIMYRNNELIFDDRAEYVSALQAEQEFTNILVVDDLHGEDLREAFDAHVHEGAIVVLDEFVVQSASLLLWEFDMNTEMYVFINQSVMNPFKDGLFVKSKYV